jgi:hypothetical protein
MGTNNICHSIRNGATFIDGKMDFLRLGFFYLVFAKAKQEEDPSALQEVSFINSN